MKSAKISKQWTQFTFSVFLLDQNKEMTPLLTEELELIQADLGKQSDV